MALCEMIGHQRTDLFYVLNGSYAKCLSKLPNEKRVAVVQHLGSRLRGINDEFRPHIHLEKDLSAEREIFHVLEMIGSITSRPDAFKPSGRRNV